MVLVRARSGRAVPSGPLPLDSELGGGGGVKVAVLRAEKTQINARVKQKVRLLSRKQRG